MGRLTVARYLVPIAASVVLFGPAGPASAESHFAEFHQEIKPALEFIAVSELRGIFEYQYSYENDSYAFWVLAQALAQNQSEVRQLLRESDQRIAEFIEEAQRASAEAARRQEEARFISIVSSFVNLTRASVNFARSIEQMNAETRMTELQKLYGDEWPSVEEQFEKLRENDLMLFQDFEEEGFDNWLDEVDEAAIGPLTETIPPDDAHGESIVVRPDVPPALAHARRIGQNLSWLQDALSDPGTIDQATYMEARERISEGYRLLFAMTPTQADQFVDDNRITVESAASDFIPDSVEDANLANGVQSGVLFFFDSQPLADETELGAGHRLFLADELNRYSRIFFAEQFNLDLGDFSQHIDLIEPKIIDAIECADRPCMFSK